VKIDLNGKVALVTGGSRGIGRSIAEVLHAAGARVALVARNDEQVTATAREIGDGVMAVAADVSDPAQVDRAIGAVEQQLGPVDVLVNNAGLKRDGLLARMSDEDWQTVLEVNLKGAFHTMKRVSRSMMKRRSGRIINVTSVVGIVGNRGQANYAASKAGLIGLTKSIAKELGSRNVLVNAVAPGFIDTDMTRDLTDAQREALTAQIPTGRLGTGQDVANAVLFLSSDLSGYITGQVVVVDGGMVM
jgi:3-oxoacyl-[acyl-carrier protein] reductase